MIFWAPLRILTRLTWPRALHLQWPCNVVTRLTCNTVRQLLHYSMIPAMLAVCMRALLPMLSADFGQCHACGMLQQHRDRMSAVIMLLRQTTVLVPY
jgi:hypothetical protein